MSTITARRPVTRSTASPVALLQDTFRRIRTGDTRVTPTGYRPGAAPVDLTPQDLRDASADAAWSLDLEFIAPWSRLSTRRPVVTNVSDMLSWWDEDHARRHPGRPQQLGVASVNGSGSRTWPRTWWWTVDGTSVYEAGVFG